MWHYEDKYNNYVMEWSWNYLWHPTWLWEYLLDRKYYFLVWLDELKK